MIRLGFLIVCIALSAVTAHAQLVTPQLTKPATEAAAGDALHEKYEAAWFRYEQAIGEVRDKVNAALDAQFEKAADAGNLDLADMWDKKKKVFANTGSVAWPSDGKTKTEWRKKHPTTDFPDEFSEFIAAAGAGFEKAVATLKDDYESLVKDYTKDRNLARAKALRDELAGLERKPVVAQERPKMVEKKPEPAVTELNELPRGNLSSPWVSRDGLRLYWQAQRGGNQGIWQAQRATQQDPFLGAKQIATGGGLSLTGDEKELFVFANDTILTARRNSTSVPFGSPRPIEELKPLGFICRPFVSPDGLLLWFDKAGDNPATRWANQQRMVTTRATTTSRWSIPKPVRSDLGVSNGFFVSVDQGYGIFPMATGFALALTNDRGQTFTNPIQLPIPANSPPGKHPFYCAATRELFYAGHPSSSTGDESALYVIRPLDLPSRGD